MGTMTGFLMAAIFIFSLLWMINSGAEKAGGSKEGRKHPEKPIPLNITVSSVKEELPEEIKPSEPLLSEEAFAGIKKCVARLRTMMGKLSRDEQLFNMINGKSTDAGGDRMPDHAYLLRVLKCVFLKDLKHCYEKTGRLFRISTYTPEGQCLLLISDLLNEESGALSAYDTFRKALNPIDHAVISTAIRYLTVLTDKGIKVSVEGDEEFAFFAMLINFDESSSNLVEYRQLMQSLVSCISSVCKEAGNKEDEWLKTLSAVKNASE